MAVVENHDDVGVLDGGQTVRDDEHRAALHQLIHAALHDGLGARVDGAGRLVEDHHRRVGDRRASDGDELALALREVRAVVGQQCVVALRQACDEVVRAGEPCRRAALLVRCVQTAVADVLHHRAGEEIRLLQNKAEGAAQIRLLDLVDVDAVVADLAVGNVVKAIDEVRDGRFARAGRADEGDLLARLGVNGYVVQHVLALGVGEVHIGEAHVAAQLGVGEGAVAVRVLPRPMTGAAVGFGHGAVGRDRGVHKRHIAVVCLGLFVDEGEHALCARARHDDRVDLLGELVDVAGELARHVEEGHKDGDVQRLAGERHVRQPDEQEHAADERERHIEDVADVADDGAEDAGIGLRAEAVLKEGVVEPVEVLDALLLVAEDLDDLLTRHHLLNEALGGGDRLLLADEVFRAAAADLLRDRDHGDDAEHEHQRQPKAEVEHDGEHHEHDRAGLNERGQCLRDELAERVDVVRVVAHDVAVLVAVKIADGQLLHPAEHLAAQLMQEALRHIRHELRVDRHGENGERVEHDEQREIGHDLRLGGGPVAADIPLFDDLDDVLREERGNGGYNGGEQDADKGDGGEHGVVGKELLHRAPQGGGTEVTPRGIGVRIHFRHSRRLRSSGIRRPRGKSRRS